MKIDGVEQVEAHEALQLMQDGAVMVDVREPQERAAGRIPGTLALPMSRFEQEWQDLPRDRPLIMQCASGLRSHHAARLLTQEGLDACNLAHGIVGWYRMGQPIDTDSE